MWRTREAVQASATPAECTGKTDLLAFYSLTSVAPAAAKALHVDYASPEHAKQFDPVGKLKGSPLGKQLYKAGEPEGRWDLLPLTRWPPHQYDFHGFTQDSIQRGLTLQPGAYSLPEADLGRPVGPDRQELANPQPSNVSNSPYGGPSDAAGGTRATGGPGQKAAGGRGKGSLGKRGRKAVATESASIASDNTADTGVTHETSSRRRRTDG